VRSEGREERGVIRAVGAGVSGGVPS
jgi:hypothetical protein